MKVLLDHNLPVKIRTRLKGHLVLTTRAMGWTLLKNGALIRAADREGFDVLITADQKMYREQSRVERKLALIVLTRPEWHVISKHLDRIATAIDGAMAGGFELVKLPQRTGPRSVR